LKEIPFKTDNNINKVAESNPTELVGEFHFCEGCPSDLNCCTGKCVDLPVLTPSDVQKISLHTSLSSEEFSIPTTGQLSKIKSKNNSCFFYKNGKCEIYEMRPIDCRLFPFDILKNLQGKFFWIVYNTTCPKPIKSSTYFSRIQSLANSLLPYLEEYAGQQAEKLDKHEYSILGEFKVIGKNSV